MSPWVNALKSCKVFRIFERTHMTTRIALALIVTIALAIPATANAHITLQPDEAAAGEFTTLDVRVPNEGSDPATTRVSLRFPPGFFYALYQAVPGWSVKVKWQEPQGSEVRDITWIAKSDSTGIQAGQFQNFPIGTQLPGEVGDTLTFKAIQTYANGAVVRWVGGPESQRPAPRVVVTDDGGDRHASASVAPEVDDSDSNGLAIAALVVGIVALLLGAGALALAAWMLHSRRAGEAVDDPSAEMPQLELDWSGEGGDRQRDREDGGGD